MDQPPPLPELRDPAPSYNAAMSAPATTPAPPAPVIVIMHHPTGRTASEHYEKNYPLKVVKALSITQIVVGALATILQIISIMCSRWGVETIGHGIWSGIFICICGSFGLLSMKKPTQCTIVTMMVFSILAAISSVPFSVISGIGFATTRRNEEILLPIHIIHFLMAIGSGVIAIVMSAIACKATCCRTTRYDGAVVYNQASGQSVQMSDLSQILATTNQTVGASAPLQPTFQGLAQATNPKANLYSETPTTGGTMQGFNQKESNEYQRLY